MEDGIEQHMSMLLNIVYVKKENNILEKQNVSTLKYIDKKSKKEENLIVPKIEIKK